MRMKQIMIKQTVNQKQIQKICIEANNVEFGMRLEVIRAKQKGNNGT